MVSSNVELSTLTLIVPTCALDDYQNANVWRNFGTIIDDEDLPCEGTNNIRTIRKDIITKIFPNPISPNATLNIENETLKAGDKLEIFDMNGKLISVNFATGIENSINIGALPQGTYLLRLAGKQGIKFEVK